VTESAFNLGNTQVPGITVGIRRLGFTVVSSKPPRTGICRVAGFGDVQLPLARRAGDANLHLDPQHFGARHPYPPGLDYATADRPADSGAILLAVEKAAELGFCAPDSRSGLRTGPSGAGRASPAGQLFGTDNVRVACVGRQRV